MHSRAELRANLDMSHGLQAPCGRHSQSQARHRVPQTHRSLYESYVTSCSFRFPCFLSVFPRVGPVWSPLSSCLLLCTVAETLQGPSGHFIFAQGRQVPSGTLPPGLELEKHLGPLKHQTWRLLLLRSRINKPGPKRKLILLSSLCLSNSSKSSSWSLTVSQVPSNGSHCFIYWAYHKCRQPGDFQASRDLFQGVWTFLGL